MTGSVVIGIDAGGTNVKGVAMDASGDVRVRRTRAAPDEPLTAVVHSFVDALVSEIGEEPRAVGLAAPGIASLDGRSIWWMQGRRDELEHLDWSAHLERAGRVRVLNDARAALIGEIRQGAAAGLRNVILLTLGTGVGGAAMVDGRILDGHLGRAGHLGHVSLDPSGPADIVGTPGSLEEAIGECSLQRRTAGRYRFTSDLLAAKDPEAERVWRESIRALAAALASFINVLDPQRVILGGGLVSAGARLFEPLARELDRMEWRPHGRRVELVAAAAGEYAGAVGAAWHALGTDGDETR